VGPVGGMRETLVGAWIVVAGCGEVVDCLPPEPEPSGVGENVLLVVLDDVGVDRLGVYAPPGEAVRTPALDGLARQGVLFRNAFNQPVCTPGRATLLTGRRALHTGVGNNVHVRGRNTGLPRSEVTLPEALAEAPGGPYTSTAIGKWHLSALDEGVVDPRVHGFDHFDGLAGNARYTALPAGQTDYFRWERIHDGEVSIEEGYLTTAQADAAIEAVRTLPEPWFVYLAFNAVHEPYHVPPAHLWSDAEPVHEAGMADAMLEALDHELARVLAEVGDDTWVFVTSDNGTSREAVRPPFRPRWAKGSLYSGGTQVPLLVSGPGVEPGVRDDLVHATDVFASVLDVAGLAPSTLGLAVDGTSLVPLLTGQRPSLGRTCAVIDAFDGRGRLSQALLDATHTLVEDPLAPEVFYRRTTPGLWTGENLLADGHLASPDRESLRRLRALGRQDH
jgi:arylsulfatase B